ncbi:MAG: DnaJ domain-containing protein [Myxococcota bacterium]
MGISAQGERARRGTPRLAPGCDPTALPLTPEEGFLLSRIDGCTPWGVLREIGGLPPDTVDRCLEAWLGKGVLEIDQDPSDESLLVPEPVVLPRVEPDLSLDLEPEIQQHILEFESRLGASYTEILGVDAGASAREIKRAYFRLSREFHPDRYFRKEIGDFAERLQRIFRKLIEAHEMLSDPMARAEMERSLAQEASSTEGEARPLEQRVAPEEARRRLARFSVDAKELLARKGKAKHYFETGMAAFRGDRWLEAAASVRLAIAFDPGNEAYRDSFAEVLQRAHEERAKQLVKEGEGALEVRDYARALHCFEEAAHFRPHDADLHHRAARLAWLGSEDLRKAKDLAQVACDLEPEESAYRRTLGQIYQAAGLDANARREIRRALELDPRDEEAKQALASLRRGGR